MAQWYCARLESVFPSGSPGSIPGPGVNTFCLVNGTKTIQVVFIRYCLNHLMAKIDPYKHKERYEKWKQKTKDIIPEVSETNSLIIKQYLKDMELGINISNVSVKGPRSYSRLNSLKDRMIFFCKKFKELYDVNKITDIKEEKLFEFFSGMLNGKIKTKKGKTYHSADTFARIFKAFWHWHIKVSGKKGVQIEDISQDLDARQEKPKWVYLNEEQVRKICDSAKYEYRVLIMFLLDTGIRSPTELINVKVSDLFNNCKELNIRKEIVKTGSFGRRIKLMLCSELLRKYIDNKGLKSDDYLFEIKSYTANKYLKRLAIRVLGDSISEAGKRYSEISLYDFRHIACCYWLPRYKSESALKYRFGWKKSDKIHYYSELLGMRDTIEEEDLLVDVTKTEIEKRLERSEKEKEIIQEKMAVMEKQLAQILEFTNQMGSDIINKNV